MDEKKILKPDDELLKLRETDPRFGSNGDLDDFIFFDENARTSER